MLDINWTLPVALVSVIVFLVLMNKILFKPLIQFMDARDKGIRDNLEAAAGLRQHLHPGDEAAHVAEPQDTTEMLKKYTLAL